MKTKTKQHTPTPWSSLDAQDSEHKGLIEIVDSEGDTVGYVDTDEKAAFVVRAVNSHEALLEALKKGEDIISGLEADADRVGVDMTEIRHWWANVAGKAIAQAEGK